MNWLFALTLFFSMNSFAQVDPSIAWKVFRLENYDVVFDARQQALAELYTQKLLQADQALRPVFPRFPQRLTLVINDRTDLTNGFATAFPYPLMMVFPVYPLASESIGDYGDWEYELLVHELTHILSFEHRRGVMKGLHSAFGSIITPNLLMPRWWLEGVAVEMETRFSNFGRLRSPQTDASLRSLYLDHIWGQIPSAEINESTMTSWPFGARPYLYGSLLWSEMLQNEKLEFIDQLHWRQGGRVPYFIDAPIYELKGKNYETLWSETQSRLQTKIASQLATLGAMTFTKAAMAPVESVESMSPSLSPDQLKLAFVVRNSALKREVRVLERKSPNVLFDFKKSTEALESKVLETESLKSPSPDGPPGGTIQKISWNMNSSGFYFDKVSEVDQFKESSDLYFYDLQRKKSTALSKGARLREPQVHSDEKSLLAIELEGGRTHLVRFDLAKKKAQRLVEGELGQRLSSPVAWNPEEVLFLRRQNGREQLVRFHVSQKTEELLLPDWSDLKNLTVFQSQLYFVSAKNGVLNVYKSPDLKTAHPITHVPTSVFHFSPESDSTLYLSVLTGEGLRLATSSRLPANSPPLPQIESLMGDRYPPATITEEKHHLPQSESYSGLPYLLPRYWLPSLNTSSQGTTAGFSTSAQDPLGKHAYTVQALYDDAVNDLSYFVQYQNQSFLPAWKIEALDLRTQLPTNSLLYEERTQLTELTWQLPKISTELFLSWGWEWGQREFLSSANRSHQYGPYFEISYLDYSQSGEQISPESGWAALLKGTHFVDRGTATPYNRGQWLGMTFWSKGLPQHHVIHLRHQGQYIDQTVSVAEAQPTVGLNSFASLPNPSPIMRGYLNGAFLAKSYLNTSLEYRFPLKNLNRGFGTAPVFLKRIHGAVVADSLSLDGFIYGKNLTYQRWKKWEAFSSSGVEVKMDMTVGYHFGLTGFLGLYKGFSDRLSEQNTVLIGIQL
ncbi:MAG: TolB family protein [Pseudobdellovibrionaceae bacterium]